jgi:hypothetical protein
MINHDKLRENYTMKENEKQGNGKFSIFLVPDKI